MLFSRNPSRSPAPTTGPSAPATGRLVVERVEGLQIQGWASTAQGLAEPALGLRRNGQDLEPLTVRRFDRADVAAALGGDPTETYGFFVELPAHLWSAGSLELSNLELRAAGLSQPLQGHLDLASQLEQVRRLPPAQAGHARLRACVRAVAHAQPAAQNLPADLLDWVRDEAARRDWAHGLTQPDAELPDPPALTVVLERHDGLVWTGWVDAPAAVTPAFELLCGSVAIPVQPVRTERRDVQMARGLSQPLPGFELELPSAIWRQPFDGQPLQLQLRVGDRLLPASPQALQPSDLLQRLEQVMRTEQQALPGDAPGAQAEQQYQVLLLLEHLAAARLLSKLPAEQARFVQRQSERFGLQALWGTDTEPPEAADAAHPAPSPEASGAQVDLATWHTWALMREFNARLQDGTTSVASALNTLQAVLQRPEARGNVRQRFLTGLIPFFCARQGYPALRPFLDPRPLRELMRAESRWANSLCLPELVACMDLPGATTVAKQLLVGPGDWLNTECLAESVRLLAAQWPDRADEQAEAQGLVQALLPLLEREAADYWGRSHDRHLVRTHIGLMGLRHHLSPTLDGTVEALTRRTHALNPSFWSAWSEAVGEDPQTWPHEIRRAHRIYRRTLEQLEAPDRPSALDAEWVTLHREGNVEAGMLLRELAMARLITDGEAPLSDSALPLLAQSEPLRLWAHPQAAAPLPPEAVQDAPELIRAVSGVPHPPQAALRAAALAAARAPACQPLDPATERQLVTLCGPAHGHLGVRLLADHWWKATSQQHASQADWLSALREQWVACFRAVTAPGLPEQALLASWHRLEASTDPAARSVAQECRRLLVARHGPQVLASLPPREGLQLTRPDPTSDTLVVVYSCRRNLATRIPKIRATWLQDLSDRQIPWVIVVGEGQGTLADGVLALPVSDAYEALPQKTLALLDWVRLRTDFEHVLKIDDDCHLAVAAFLASGHHLTQHYVGRRLHRAEGGTDRRWHCGRASSAVGQSAIDKSPEPSTYADGGAGYALSRHALAELDRVRLSTQGARLQRSAYMEDKLLGDLLAAAGIALSNLGHETLVRRRFGPGATPVNAHQNVFYPGPCSPTLVSHLDDAEPLPEVQDGLQRALLQPARLWPSYAAPRLGGRDDVNQLELLSPLPAARALAQAPVLVVAVARNERVLMPHFLAHYRRLGVAHFLLVDNLSDDGTREYLLGQPDVVLYSADTQYRHSHYGVAWQQALMAGHALNKWVILADIDEFLVYPDCDQQPVANWLHGLQSQGFDAAMTLMIDMYPAGPLEAADFGTQAPFEAAPHFDRVPMIRWHLGSGCFSNSPTYLSGLRHRLIPDSAPNFFTSQKLAVLRYRPWVRLSEGLHYASNLSVSPQAAYFAHFKYHRGFRQKVMEEIRRQQHFNGAQEYERYRGMVAESGVLMDPTHSVLKPPPAAAWAAHFTHSTQ